MKKEFLDQLYDRRHKIVEAIKLVNERSAAPKSHCTTCESDCDEDKNMLACFKSELQSIDSFIVGYIKTHND